MGGRGIRRAFGGAAVPDPTTFGCWLRRAGPVLLDLLDELLWHLVRARWTEAGVPEEVTLALDSTVRVRYGTEQAGAEHGYNPKKPGRPNRHPLLAFLVETGVCLGVRSRPGSAWSGVERAPVAGGPPLEALRRIARLRGPPLTAAG